VKYAPIKKNEVERLCSLHDLGILDTLSDKRFDIITKQASEMFNVPIATVTVIDEDKELYISKQGISDTSGPRNISFCGHALYQTEIMIIEDTHKDDRFADNPYVIGPPYVRFYAGKSLHRKKDEQPIGVFCIKDIKPRKMSIQEIEQFLTLAAKAEDILNLADQS